MTIIDKLASNLKITRREREPTLLQTQAPVKGVEFGAGFGLPKPEPTMATLDQAPVRSPETLAFGPLLRVAPTGRRARAAGPCQNRPALVRL